MMSKIWAAMMSAAPLRQWAIIGACVPLTAFEVGLVWIVWRGPWEASQQPLQLNILGWALWAALGLTGVVVISLAAVSVKAHGPGDTGFEIDGDGK
jgi:hypothetical protein